MTPLHTNSVGACAHWSNIGSLVEAQTDHSCSQMCQTTVHVARVLLKIIVLTTGVASVVEPALRILDSLYATRITMDNLQTAYGDDPEKWPSRVIASLRVRNDHLVQQIEQHICVLPPHSYCPIGAPPPLPPPPPPQSPQGHQDVEQHP